MFPRRSAVNGRWPLWLFWLAFAFTGLALLQLGLVNNSLRPQIFIPLLVLVGCSGVTIFILQRRAPHKQFADPLLLPLVFFLCGLGLPLIARLAPPFVNRQLFWLVIATAVLLLVNLIPKNLNWLYRYK